MVARCACLQLYSRYAERFVRRLAGASTRGDLRQMDDHAASVMSAKYFGRTWAPGSAEKLQRCDRLLLRGNDFLALLTQLLDPKGDHIAGLEKHGRWLHAKADARRRPGDDDVAGLHHEEL